MKDSSVLLALTSDDAETPRWPKGCRGVFVPAWPAVAPGQAPVRTGVHTPASWSCDQRDGVLDAIA